MGNPFHYRWIGFYQIMYAIIIFYRTSVEDRLTHYQKGEYISFFKNIYIS